MPILSWADDEHVARKRAEFERYLQQLWRTAMATRVSVDRAILLAELERLNNEGPAGMSETLDPHRL